MQFADESPDPLPFLDEAAHMQRRQRIADGGARNIEHAREIVLARQHGADVVAARQDAVAQHQEHLLVQRIAKLPADRDGFGQSAVTGRLSSDQCCRHLTIPIAPTMLRSS